MKKLRLINTAILSALAAFGAMVRNDATAMDALRQNLIQLAEHSRDIQAAADAENRALTDEENAKIDENTANFERIDKDLKRREKIEAQNASLAQPQARQTAPSPVPAAQAQATSPQAAAQQPAANYRMPRDPVEQNRHGFLDFGEFARSVCRGSRPVNAVIDPRLIMDAPTTITQEGVGVDGGFLVPPEFRREIMQLIMDEEDLLSRTDEGTTSSNSVTEPKDETTPWQDSGGVQVYWDGEADQMTQSKVSLKENTTRLNKLTCLVPVTEEQIEDASQIDSYLRRKVPGKMSFKISNAIINGNGAGKPLGFMNSGALVTVAKESGQAADTIVYENITKMWARMYGPSRRNAVWLHNQDIEPQLDTMSFEGTSSSVPAYFPPGGIADSPYGRLKGRPLIPTQAAQTVGDLGDIMLVDLKQYQTIKKTTGMRTDVSMHLWFDYDVSAFRFILRIAGQPYLSAPIDPLNGSATLSPFVALAARA